MAPIEFGNFISDGNSIRRAYKDDEAGFSGFISASIGGSAVEVEHFPWAGAEPRTEKVTAEDAQHVVMEDAAALSAIQGVIEGEQQAVA